MSKKENSLEKKAAEFPRFANIIVIFLNAILLSGVFIMYMLYNSAYEERLHEENLGNIANLNRSSAMNATALLDSWEVKLNDIIQYADIHNLSKGELLDMINDANSSGDRYFELIGGDYTGVLAKKDEGGTYPVLDYSNGSYSTLQNIFDRADGEIEEIGYAPEYTDGGKTAEKFFAIYRYLSIVDEDNILQPYTLMLAASSENVLEVLNSHNDYVGQSSVLIDASGNYIVSNRDFKSSNFFQYLYVYNDLTLDEKNSVKEEMNENGSGVLYYKNAGTVVEDCVFSYDRMPNSNWFCVTCVPLSSFHTPTFNINYIIHAIIFLLVLLITDVLWLQAMNSRLRISILREKEAGAAKGSFMSRMSHEIRTPLNAVIGYNTIARNEMLNVRSEDERKQAIMKVMDCLDKSEIASKHLLTIINDVLDMAAIESGKIKVAHERFDFKGLITSLTTIFYTQARAKGIEFEVIFDTLTEEWFVGDQMRTNQILTNLLSNAVKFTPEGGSVTLKINQPEADTNASHIHFEVNDTGIGMTQEYLSHIWTPFEQADSSISRRFGGTGLGLSITKNLVDILGGTISVKSTPGTGTEFTVDLTFEPTEQTESTQAYDFSIVNALVVDDDISTCDYIRLLFTRCGASCASVTSGADAVKAIQIAMEKGERYTIFLVDWKMPNMDGIETIKEIRKLLGNDTPVIVLTAYDYTEIADKAIEAGVSKFISKPLFQSSLFDLLVNTSGKQMHTKMERHDSFDFTGARVLLAEDNLMNMEIAKKILESTGLIVDSAWNGREAVEMFTASEAGTYIAILMDVHMPEMNGHEATRAIRSSQHHEAKTIPIIAMTADAFAENVAEAYESGMDAHISKPIDIRTLLNTLKKYR